VQTTQSGVAKSLKSKTIMKAKVFKLKKSHIDTKLKEAARKRVRVPDEEPNLEQRIE